MPCGTGKTLTAFWIAQALDAQSVLVAVPSLALVKQTVDDWAREWVAHGEQPAFTIVCSDETTGELPPDSFVGQAYDLGLPSYTDPKEIAARLDAHRHNRHLVFTTYQSSRMLAEAARQSGVTFDLAILDEAHKTVGATSKTFATLLHDRNVPIARRVYMTATERVLRGKNDDVLSMDDAAVYGECFHLYTFKDAIAEGVISDYRILTVTVTEQSIARFIRENRLLTLDSEPEALDARAATELAAGVALQRTFQDYGVAHAISFHRSIRAAVQFREQQEALGTPQTGITNLHISGMLPAGRRKALLDEFASCRRALMTNARCLTEGVDVPAIDCVLFTDPKRSTIDIVQATGRALRPAQGKALGYVLLPLVVPDGLTFDEFAETTPFKHVARVVATLSTQDDRIAEEFRAITRDDIPSGRLVEFTGDVLVGMHVDPNVFVDAIRTKLWERVACANWRSFEDARQFVQSLGLKSVDEWVAYCSSGNKPSDIPASPEHVYANQGWAGMSDWLGTGRFSETSKRPLQQARVFVHNLRFKNVDEWRAYCRSGAKPPDIPTSPNVAYADSGWVSWGDWLGTGRHRGQGWLPFKEARAIVRQQGLTDYQSWRAYCRSGKKPPNIPSTPEKVYASEWQGIDDWLGTGRHRRKSEWRPFDSARTFMHRVGLRSQSEWFLWRRSPARPPEIPTNPHVVYRDQGWRGIADWLGCGSRKRSVESEPPPRDKRRHAQRRRGPDERR